MKVDFIKYGIFINAIQQGSTYNSMVGIMMVFLLSLSACSQKNKVADEQVVCEIDTEYYIVEPDSGYCKSDNPADSVWINTLNSIKLPNDIEQDTLNVYFKYESIINGYEVTARWMPFCSECEVGYIVMSFYRLPIQLFLYSLIFHAVHIKTFSPIVFFNSI